MQIEVLADPDAVAGRAAALIAKEARTVVAERGRFVMAVSGGHTPWMVLRAQVNELVAPGRVRRNNALVLADLVAAGSRRQGA
jgi:6-phosphogluconolactonase/glucosamine-6-phosphate isomerase/deaminase